MGADEIVHADNTDVCSWFREHYPNGVDRVIVTSPPKTLLDAVKIANFGAIISYIGIDFGGAEMVTFDMNEIHFKRLQIRASHAVPNLMFPIALEMIRNNTINASLLVSHIFPLKKASEALDCTRQMRSRLCSHSKKTTNSGKQNLSSR
ncbi:MAG: zinc-binding dehydrogenase [Armatimonadota bacterium]